MSIWHVYDLPSIDEFAGPREGFVQLPFHLYWTNGSRVFDLSKLSDLNIMYNAVISEGTKEEVIQYLNKDLFIENLGKISIPRKAMEIWGISYGSDTL